MINIRCVSFKYILELFLCCNVEAGQDKESYIQAIFIILRILWIQLLFI
jgi:hypothetical protein